MTKLFLAMFSIFSLSAVGAVPELPFPTGSCSGLIPLDAADTSGDGDGASSISLVLDFDDRRAYGSVVFFDDNVPGVDDRLSSEWSLDQDDSGISLEIVRDDLIPASFIVSFTIDEPTSDSVDVVTLRPTGNAFDRYEVVLRLLPNAGGASYPMQLVSAPYSGFCNAL